MRQRKNINAAAVAAKNVHEDVI
uniref:Uncharacterized protein n=1 Tax=Steinernema glaseri TaxID=37863 RepID=A0A1I7Z8I6_9BILA